MSLRTRIACALIAAILAMLAGWFCAWIGGVHPFTSDAGGAAVMTLMTAIGAFLAVLAATSP